MRYGAQVYKCCADGASRRGVECSQSCPAAWRWCFATWLAELKHVATCHVDDCRWASFVQSGRCSPTRWPSAVLAGLRPFKFHCLSVTDQTDDAPNYIHESSVVYLLSLHARYFYEAKSPIFRSSSCGNIFFNVVVALFYMCKIIHCIRSG